MQIIESSKKIVVCLFRQGLNRKLFFACLINHFYTLLTENIEVRLRLLFYISLHRLIFSIKFEAIIGTEVF